MLDMEQFKSFMNEAPGFNRHNGIRFTVVEEGYCECEVDLTQEGRNPQGVAHGSLLFALCDCVTGMAAATTGRSMLTQSAGIHYLRPGTGGRLTAKSRMIKNGRTTALCVGEVYDETGRLLATSEFEVFYTSTELTLPERDGDGVWRSAAGEGQWS
ncbi:MAG: PaaI family thioesterase [Oscillospiraceae bacterium]|nr:PaaI family thioesterase [Oscillospiraceae bacterium]